MKVKAIIALSLLAVAPLATKAQVSEECLTNISLFHESAKNKQYADAFEPWMAAFKNCPAASANIYSDGAKILAWKISTCQPGSEEYNTWRNVLMEMYDTRIANKVFGKNNAYPAPYILGLKAIDYCKYFTEDALKLPAYGWLKECVDGMGAKTQIVALRQLADLSLALYKAEPSKYADQYISDYQLVSELLNGQASDSNNKNADAARAQKDYIDNMFAASGAANCDKLDELYAATVEANKENLDMLNKIIKLYRSVGCVESDVYFAAAAASHVLAPTAESAAGCASMSRKKGDYKAAIDYYNQATELSEIDQDKADYQFNIGNVYYQYLKNLPAARAALRKSLDYVADQGRCYMLIGVCYAESTPYSKEEYGAKANILNKTVYWVAVDKFNKAKAVDPTVAEAANKLISTYAKYFPTKEERFDLPGEFSGSTFTVGGWIGETTVIR